MHVKLPYHDYMTLCHSVFHFSDFWIHLESLTALVLQMIAEVQKLDPKIKSAMQMHLQYIADHQISVLEWEMRTAQDQLTVPLKGHGGKLGKSAVDLNKAILYLMEGFIPLLSGFSSKLCAHICGQNMECTMSVTPQKMHVLCEFTKALQVSIHVQIHTYTCIHMYIYIYAHT